MKGLFQRFKNLVRQLGVWINTPTAQLPPHCGNINALLLHLCDFDHDLHKWVLRWIAYPLRHPGAKMSTCLLINGGEGTGKNMFFEGVVKSVYGPVAQKIYGHHLSSRFNGWAAGTRLAIVDEMYSPRMLNRLKALVTAKHVLISEMGKPDHVEDNRMNFVFLSGALNFLPAAVADRRFVVVEAPPARNAMFYRAVHAEIQNGGIDAFRQYLMSELDMADFHEHSQPPKAASNADREAA